MADVVLVVQLEIPYDENLDDLLRNPEKRSEEISLEIGFAGWPARITGSHSEWVNGGRK